MFSQLDHVGIAVSDLDEALDIYRDQFNLEVICRETIRDQGLEAILLDIGQSHVELLQSLRDDSSIAKFMATRGPGLHHVAYRVQDIDTSLPALAAKGVRLVDDVPRRGIRGSRVGFLHPSSVLGVLTELVELP